MFSPQTHKTINVSKITAAVLLPIAALISQPALAQTNSNISTVKVAYSDLNLASEKGQKRLSQRINAAVKKVCNIHGSRNITERQNEQKCKAQAMKRAYRQVSSVLTSQKNVNVKVANSRIFIVGN